MDEFYIIRNSFNKEPSKENIITIIKKIFKDSDPKIELSLFEEYFNNFLNNRIVMKNLYSPSMLKSYLSCKYIIFNEVNEKKLNLKKI